MNEKNLLAEQFEAKRGQLKAVAYRMLGSRAEAEDAVQESWIRLSRSDADEIGNLGGWLTTVVARICLDMLRSRKARREEEMPPEAVEPEIDALELHDPEREIAMADSVGLALLVVLDTLQPAERIAFVLHDMFDLSFEAIAPIVDRSPEAARQLASRARRRVQGRPDSIEADRDRRRQVVEAFLAASRNGDFEALLAVLDPHVVLRADAAAAQLGRLTELRGAPAVAEFFNGRARTASAILAGGEFALLVGPISQPLIVVTLTYTNGRISGLQAIADPERLADMHIERLER